MDKYAQSPLFENSFGILGAMKTSNQFLLLLQRRFAPLFWVQFGGALNDNVVKNALAILVAYRALTIWGFSTSALVNLAAGLFILPFFIFSATAGQLADRFEKTKLIKWVKALEVIIALLATWGFITDNLQVLLIVLFLLGLQATLFGPIKYSILPLQLAPEELLAGNALIETGTFIAILVGTVLGSWLIVADQGALWVSSLAVVIALAGWILAFFIPPTTAQLQATVSLNPITAFRATLQSALKNKIVFIAILAISWFWFFGALILTQMPIFTKNVLHGDAHVVTFILTLFSIGIGLGALLCNRLAHHQVELGLVILGAAVLALFFGLFLWFIPTGLAPLQLFTLTQFLSYPDHWPMILSLLLLSIGAGFYTVPLYTLLQAYSSDADRSRTIAANNIFNALFMVVAALLGMIVFSYNGSIEQLFMITLGLHIVVNIALFIIEPEYWRAFLRFARLSNVR